MDILRFLTAGSVDDGKSTLIGRLLFDNGSIYLDQLDALMRNSKRSDKSIDLSLLTDGLRSEREQGITIDVAYRYFNTATRKFIIADAPGHFQYTRNLVTAASNSDVAIILVDATKGIVEQTKRHSMVLSMMGIRNVAVAVNKMDLVNYSEDRFVNIRNDFDNMQESLDFSPVFIPISALHGDNVFTASKQMAWYNGSTLMEYLENVEPVNSVEPFRFRVQCINRDSSGARFYAGQVLSGKISSGSRIKLLPGSFGCSIRKILIGEEEITAAVKGQSICFQIDQDLDLQRGDLFVCEGDNMTSVNHLNVRVAWFDQKMLIPGKKYILQSNSFSTRVLVKDVDHIIKVEDLSLETISKELKFNDLGAIQLRTAEDVYFDSFKDVPSNGRAILVDEVSNATVAACIVI